MNFLRMLQKFFRSWLFNKRAKDSNDYSNIIDRTHSISMILHSDSLLVDVIMLHPKLTHLSNEEIYQEAEKFAEFLVYVSNDLWEPKILNTLNNKNKNTDNDREILFYNNVIYLYQTIKAELGKNLDYNGPLIRPRSAFNQRP